MKTQKSLQTVNYDLKWKGLVTNLQVFILKTKELQTKITCHLTPDFRIQIRGNKLGQRQSQTPFSSAFWFQKDCEPKKFWVHKVFDLTCLI